MSLRDEIDELYKEYLEFEVKEGDTPITHHLNNWLRFREGILTTISKHLPEKRPRFGPQNENGDYAPEEYENGGYNEAIDQVNKLLTTNKKDGKV